MATKVRTRRWTRPEYEHLVDLGMFRPDERLELVGGELIVREPQGGPHALAIELVGDALRSAFGPGWRVRTQLPVALDGESEPEPDFSVVPGTPREAAEPIPSLPALIVEVAETSLRFDRDRKGSLYARARVPDYWIVNLIEGVLHVYREPRPAPEAPYGWRYADVQTLGRNDSVSPLAVPSARIVVADLLP
jgi:Uma2 family endonuclease